MSKDQGTSFGRNTSVHFKTSITLNNLMNGHGLEKAANYFFKKQFADKKWSAQANCQQFTRELVAHFGLPWPEDVSVIGDVCPWAIDFALEFIGSS
jgi:hypothetical protein